MPDEVIPSTSTDTSTGDVMLQVTDEPQKNDAATPGQGDAAIDTAKPDTVQPAQVDAAKPDAAGTDATDAAAVDGQPSPVVPEPKPHDVLASIFENYDTPDAAVGAAMESLDKLYDPKTGTGYDQNAYFTLANAIYHREKEWLTTRALTDAGIPKERIAEFVDWSKSGAALPAPPEPVKFPEPDQDGFAEFQGIQYNTSDAVGKQLYDNAKRLFGLEEKERAGETQRLADQTKAAADAKVAEQTKIRQQQETRVNTFTAERDSFLVSEVKEATKDYGSPLLQAVGYSLVNQLMAGEIPDLLKNVPELKLALGLVGQMNALSDRAGPHIINGDGRTADFGKAADAIYKQLVAAALSPLNRMILRINQAERAALSGVPKIPGVAQVTAGTQVETDGKPKTEAEIEKTLMAGIGKKFGA